MIFTLVAACFANAGDFKGFYVGGNAGVALGRSSADTTTIYSPTGYFATTSPPAIAALSPQHPRSTGFTGGGQAGYNFQSGSFVFGIEADFGAMRLDASQSGTAVYPCCSPTAFTVSQRAGSSWLFTARPRIGWTHGPVLIYTTGGLALTTIHYREAFSDTFATAAESSSFNTIKTGWTGGAGLEFKVARHWSVKSEYLYNAFGRVSKTSDNLTAFTPAIAYPTNVFTHSTDLRTHIIRAGINYRF